MRPDPFKNIINIIETKSHQSTCLQILYKQDLVLNNLPRLIFHKTQQTKPNHCEKRWINAFLKASCEVKVSSFSWNGNLAY